MFLLKLQEGIRNELVYHTEIAANKDVLIWFLNMVLEDVEIKSVDFIPTENLGLTEEDRKVIFDISCECTDGKTFIIEMQKGYQKYFRERALYYTTYPINAQGRKARDLYESDRCSSACFCLRKLVILHQASISVVYPEVALCLSIFHVMAFCLTVDSKTFSCCSDIHIAWIFMMFETSTLQICGNSVLMRM